MNTGTNPQQPLYVEKLLMLTQTYLELLQLPLPVAVRSAEADLKQLAVPMRNLG